MAAIVFALALGTSVPATSQILEDTELIEAIRDKDLELVNKALVNGERATAKSRLGKYAILEAAETGSVDIAQLLIDNGANVNVVYRKTGETPLQAAAARGYEEMAELLVEEEAELDREDRQGETPLIKAVRQGHAGMVALLIEAGADINLGDYTGRTPLSYAREGRNREIIRLLQAAGGV